jgi:hypothetical protein
MNKLCISLTKRNFYPLYGPQKFSTGMEDASQLAARHLHWKSSGAEKFFDKTGLNEYIN